MKPQTYLRTIRLDWAWPLLAVLAFSGPARADAVAPANPASASSASAEAVSAALRAANLETQPNGSDFDSPGSMAPAPLSAVDRSAIRSILRPQLSQNGQTPGRDATRSVAQTQGRSAEGKIEDGDDTSHAIKETVRPILDEISNSGVVDAMRTLKAELVPEKDRQVDPRTLKDEPSAKLHEGDADSDAQRNWSGAGGGSVDSVRAIARSEAQVKSDRVMAALAMEQLLDSLQPWAIGFAILAGLYALGRLAWHFVRRSQARSRKRRVLEARATQDQRVRHSTRAKI